jgi:glyoxylase-like metal-dependent hydrolase (beta-lactamase superfamily II)
MAVDEKMRVSGSWSGTRFEPLPTRGGETDDALLIHMPEQGVLFVGDILMAVKQMARLECMDLIDGG